MFWDRRASSVEDQATQPMLNPVEMGWQDNRSMAALNAKMEWLEYYPPLFEFMLTLTDETLAVDGRFGDPLLN